VYYMVETIHVRKNPYSSGAKVGKFSLTTNDCACVLQKCAKKYVPLRLVWNGFKLI
jgi:hypothetical protein